MPKAFGEPSKGNGFAIAIRPLIKRIVDSNFDISNIPIKDICVKNGIRNTDRLRRANILYPCVVLCNVENPEKKKYRMVSTTRVIFFLFVSYILNFPAH